MKTTMSSKGRIVLPAAIREQDHIEPGDEFAVERLAEGPYRLVRNRPLPNEGLIDRLLACPEKDFLFPSNRSRPANCEMSRRRERPERANEVRSPSPSPRLRVTLLSLKTARPLACMFRPSRTGRTRSRGRGGRRGGRSCNRCRGRSRSSTSNPPGVRRGSRSSRIRRRFLR
jgi:AbrB family looped-hinge helix DNA binding protein